MGQFDRQIATALKLVKKNGQQVTWESTANVIADSTKPWLPTSGAVVTYQPFICFLPLDREGKEFLIAMGQSEAVYGSYYGLMGAQAFAPNLKDTVTRNGVKLDITSIDVLAPNGQIILYTIVFNG